MSGHLRNFSTMFLAVFIAFLVGLGTYGYASEKGVHGVKPKKGDVVMPLTIESPAFSNNGEIPKPYTCDGEDISPALQW